MALLTTKRGSGNVVIEIRPMMRPGHVALADGVGLAHTPDGEPVGVSPDELTSSDDREQIAATPYHKHVPARLAPVRASPVA